MVTSPIESPPVVIDYFMLEANPWLDMPAQPPVILPDPLYGHSDISSLDLDAYDSDVNSEVSFSDSEKSMEEVENLLIVESVGPAGSDVDAYF